MAAMKRRYPLVMSNSKQPRKRLTLQHVMDCLSQMTEVMGQAFTEQDRKFTWLFQQLDQKIDGVDDKLTRMIGQLEAKMLRRFDEVDQRFKQMDVRFDKLEARVGILEPRP